jgi:hypothetical protein
MRSRSRFTEPSRDFTAAFSPAFFWLPSLSGVPLAIWPALFLERVSTHAAKSALALEAPSVTAFDANVVAHASF